MGIYVKSGGSLIPTATTAGLQGIQGIQGVPGPTGATGSPTAFELRGTGFPEGVVTASVGTYYTDTSATNGAIRWIKATGAGNTGWKVLYGDTGWRNVSTWAGALTVAAGGDKLHVRRVLGQVMFAIRGTATSGSYGAVLFTATSGFLPFGEIPGGITYFRNYGPAGAFVTAAGAFSQYTATANQPIDYQDGWITNDGWPATLPGTAV